MGPGYSMTISKIRIASTDFTRFFHDYVKHTPLHLTSAGFSITISNTLSASTDFEAMGVLDIVIEKPAEVSRSGECV
jgi:hypothetical protein